MNKDTMRQAGFSDEVDKVEQGLCPFCSEEIDMDDFREPINVKEYKISGLCQDCQDEIFGRQ